MEKTPNRTTAAALLVVGAIAALACVSAIGAATTLVVMATSDERDALVPHERECAVVAWKSGEVHCFKSDLAAYDSPRRGDLAVVTQAGYAR